MYRGDCTKHLIPEYGTKYVSNLLGGEWWRSSTSGIIPNGDRGVEPVIPAIEVYLLRYTVVMAVAMNHKYLEGIHLTWCIPGW